MSNDPVPPVEAATQSEPSVWWIVLGGLFVTAAASGLHVLAAFGEGFCSTWGNQCGADEQAAIQLYGKFAIAFAAAGLLLTAVRFAFPVGLWSVGLTTMLMSSSVYLVSSVQDRYGTTTEFEQSVQLLALGGICLGIGMVIIYIVQAIRDDDSLIERIERFYARISGSPVEADQGTTGGSGRPDGS